MTFVVPFDGSELSEAALARAVAFSEALEVRVVAVSVVPKGNEAFARNRDLLSEDESYDVETIVSRLHDRVHEIAPEADFRHEIVSTYAPAGTIAKEIRRFARGEDASMVFLGSDNAGRFVTRLSSVSTAVSSTQEYDVVIVRHTLPSDEDRLEESMNETVGHKSDYFLPE